MLLIAVVGGKKSGKTTTVEALVRGLTGRGYQVATVKHVPEKGFTLDTEGKDTWRHARAGANTVVVVASNELGIIRKTDTTKLSLQEIVANCKDSIDIIIFEGFRNLVKSDPMVLKIVTINSLEEAVEASNQFRPIIAFAGVAARAAKDMDAPSVDALKEPERLIEIVEKNLRMMR
jgi:molybdopterin-guanine dinucleotide biosynthesis protein B